MEAVRDAEGALTAWSSVCACVCACVCVCTCVCVCVNETILTNHMHTLYHLFRQGEYGKRLSYLLLSVPDSVVISCETISLGGPNFSGIRGSGVEFFCLAMSIQKLKVK